MKPAAGASTPPQRRKWLPAVSVAELKSDSGGVVASGERGFTFRESSAGLRVATTTTDGDIESRGGESVVGVVVSPPSYPRNSGRTLPTD